MSAPIFHLAFPAHDIKLAKQFYIDGLGCELGRESEHALILNLGGHQLVAHLVSEALPYPDKIYPRHFGLVFKNKNDWQQLAARAEKEQLTFYRKPFVRHEGKITEHHSFFLIDPTHNLLEFKFYAHQEAIFGAQDSVQVGEAG